MRKVKQRNKKSRQVVESPIRSRILKDMIETAYPLKNDVFMLFARNKAFCQEFLRVILQDKKLLVIDNEIQKHLPNMFSKDVILDMLCRLGDNRIVNVEIQLTYEKEHAKRILEYISKIKSYLMEKGAKYRNIKDTIVIYLTKEDIFHKGSTVYEVDMNVVSDRGKIVEKWESGMKVYYVNTEGLTNKTINEYLKILLDKTTYNKKYKVTSETKRDLFEKGEVKMSNEFRKLLVREKRQGIKQGIEQGIKQGKEEGMIETIVSLVKDNIITISQAAKQIGMSETEFATLIK